MPKSPKRRFVGLDTQEVSLVDSPANEVEFLVVKNTEDQSMSATAAAKKQREVETVEDDDVSSDVSKALAHVDGIVAKIATLVTAKSEKQAPPADSDEGDDESTEETETEKAAKTLKGVLAKCGMDQTMAKTVYSSLKAAGFDLSSKAATGKGGFPFPPKPGKGKGAKGGDDEPDGDEVKEKTKKAAAEDDADAPLTMANFATAVQKAAAFTPARIEQLKNAQEILKLMLEAVTPGTSPDSSVPAVSSHGNASGVSDLTKPNTKPSVPTMKSADGEIVQLIKSLAGAVDGLVDRVQAIEKARPGSNAVTEEGGTDTNVAKSSMWKGVL